MTLQEDAAVSVDSWDVEVLTVSEAAALLRVSGKTVMKLAREGQLPGRKVGREWRFARSELLSWLSSAA